MSKRFSTIAALCVLLASCGEKDAYKSSPLASADELSVPELGRQLKQKAGRKIKEILAAGRPRVVPRGAKPEIIIKGDQIRIDGKPVVMGEPIGRWKAVIPGKPRCNGNSGDVACSWDALGITLLAEQGRVMHFTIHLNLTPWELLASILPDGRPDPRQEDQRPKTPFRGYFELDGYGSDANTQFWEIRASVDPARNVRCDFLTNNCGNTTARFSNDAIIFFELDQSISERGKLADFTIGVIPTAATNSSSSPEQ